MDTFASARAAAQDVVSSIDAAAAECDLLMEHVLALPDDDDRLAHLGRGKYKIADEVRELQGNLNGIWCKLIAERIEGEL